MKVTIFAINAILISILARASDDQKLHELVAARTRYKAAIAAVTKPVRTKYLADLQQMKSRAMTKQNLELAIAIDKEIKNLSVVSESADEVPDDESSLPLAGSRWSWWSGSNKDQAWIEFRSDGLMGRGWADTTLERFKWSMVDNLTVKFRVYDAGEQFLRFNKGLTEATEVTSEGKPTGKKTERIKVPTK